MSENTPTTPPADPANLDHVPVEPPELRRRPWIFYGVGATLVLAFATTAVVVGARRESKTEAQREERRADAAKGTKLLVSKVVMTPPERVVTVTGDVRPYRSTAIHAKVSGYLRDLRVDRGDKVKAGQVLGVIESPETDVQASSALAALTLRRQNLERVRPLAKEGVASKAELDKAEAELRIAEADLSRFSSLRGYEIIRAPFEGVITARYADIGALMPAATSSTQSALALVDLQDLSQVRVMSYLSMTDAPYVKVGDKVVYRTDDGRSVEATVSRTAQTADPKSRTMLVEADVKNEPTVLFPGSFCTATFEFAAPPAPSVPLEAVFLRAGKTFVAKIVDGVAHFTAVDLGDTDGRSVRVFSGVGEGDVVGLYVGDAIADGARVDAVERAAKAK